MPERPSLQVSNDDDDTDQPINNMPRKDPFKQPGAVKFQLVHRSQRDPLIHDPEASQNILKPIGEKKVCLLL